MLSTTAGSPVRHIPMSVCIALFLFSTDTSSELVTDRWSLTANMFAHLARLLLLFVAFSCAIRSCVAVPPLVGTYNMEASLHILHQVSVVCTLR